MPLSTIIDSHSITHNSIVDDIQLQMCAPEKMHSLVHSFRSYISDMKAWATANMHTLLVCKAELMLVISISYLLQSLLAMLK